MDNNSTTAAGVIATLFLVYGLVFIAIVAFTIWVYWRIFVKAGHNGALSLLNLVPGFGQLICMIILAFGRWPIEDELAALRTAGRIPDSMPPPAPPGSSVMPTV